MRDKERDRIRSKAYRENHPDKAAAATKRWRDDNREQVIAVERRWRAENVARSLFTEAKGRSKKRGVAFTIALEDIPAMGTHCPLLGHPFAPANSGSPFAPSLDRINPKIGYVPGNVWIVGRRANMIKNDGTAEEHEQIARAMRAVEASAP